MQGTVTTPFVSPSPAPQAILLPTSPRLNLPLSPPSLPPEPPPLANQHCLWLASDMNLESPAPSNIIHKLSGVN